MHPSKVHQSTTKAPDSGLRLGFTDIHPTPGQPSGISQETPTKAGISSPSFDFRFARPGPQLGPDAQRMMDGLREEALRIKAKLAAEREEKLKNEGETAGGIGSRKIAQPKGKVGRFSDIHMAEFKKMDSIAGHPSSYRAQPGRVTPAKKTLKRTQSKAKLDEKDETTVEHIPKVPALPERLENTAPAKRARMHRSDDTSSARPASREGGDTIKMVPSTPNLARTQSTLLSSITTPTQSSLARSVNAKPSSHIPTLLRSPSKPALNGTPRGLTKSSTTPNLRNKPKSASKNFLRSPGTFERVRSILRYPSSSRKPPAPPTSIPTLSKSASKADLRSLPSAPTTPLGLARTKSIKHVNFTPDTANPHPAMTANSPSPMKSGIPRSTSKLNLAAASRSAEAKPAKEILYPSLSGHPALAKYPSEVAYPSLATPRPLPEPPRQARTEPRPAPPPPTVFHFRSDRTLDFGSPPKSFGSSPGQASVRQVRPSIFSGNIPSDFPDSNKENTAPLPSIPHGMPNKKRRRASDDEVEDEIEHSPKKQKASVAEGPKLVAPRLMATMKSRTPSPTKKKGGLTLSRLNMLARPKMRK